MLCLHLEILKIINIIAIKYLHFFDAVRSCTIIHISMIISKMSEKLWLGLIISSAEIKEDVSLLLRFLMCSINYFLPRVKRLRHHYLLLIIISMIISLLLIHLVHSSSSQSLPWNLKLKFFFSLLTNHMVYTPVPFAYWNLSVVYSLYHWHI